MSTTNRFKGELYGVGSNHTKYKSKYQPSNNSTSNGNGPYQLQFSSSVHYPASQTLTLAQTTGNLGTTTFGYEEAY